MKSSRNINWLLAEDIDAAIQNLSKEFPDDPIIVIINEPLEFIANLEAVEHFYGSDLWLLCAVIIRTVIKGHPLRDGNKRLGMLLGELFLENNGFSIESSDEELVDVALKLARSQWDKEELYKWLCKHIIKSL